MVPEDLNFLCLSYATQVSQRLKVLFVNFPENQSKANFKPRIFPFLLQIFFSSFFFWGGGGGGGGRGADNFTGVLFILFYFFLLKLLLYQNVSHFQF